MKRSIVFSLIAILGAVLIQIHLSGLGFPDGHLTELNRAEKNLLPVFVWGSAVMIPVFLYLGWKVPKKIHLALYFYLALSAVIFFIDLYLRSNLDNGIGG